LLPPPTSILRPKMRVIRGKVRLDRGRFIQRFSRLQEIKRPMKHVEEQMNL